MKLTKLQRTLLSVALILASLGVLVFILYQVGFSKIYGTLLDVQPAYLILSFISMFLMFFTWNLKWYLITRKAVKTSFMELFPMLMAGAFINTITPGARVGGGPLRLHYLCKTSKKRKSVLFPTLAVDQATNALAFYILSVLSILFVVLFFKINYIAKIILELFLVFTFLISVGGLILKKRFRINILKLNITKLLSKVYHFRIFNIIRKRFDTYNNFEMYIIERLKNITESFKKLSEEDVLFKRDILLAFMMWIFNYAGTYFIFRGFGLEITPLAVVIVVTLSMILGSLLLVPGGIGVIETIMISLYTSFGINPGISATVAVVDRFIYYFYALIVGFICLSYLQIKYK